jgi:hypothetical protein
MQNEIYEPLFFLTTNISLKLNSKKLLEPLQSQWLQIGVPRAAGIHEHD